MAEYVYSDTDLAVSDTGGTIVDPDKPLDCGRTPYTVPHTCSFDVRNTANAAVDVVITVSHGGLPAFTLTSPIGTPPGGPIPIAPGATQTITITFTPLAQSTLESQFTAGVIVSIGRRSAGRALCGIGFLAPGATDAPPAPGTEASLACR